MNSLKHKLNELAIYITESIEQGLEDEIIYETLRNAGWGDRLIDNAFEKAKRLTAKKPAEKGKHHLAYLASDVMEKTIISAPKHAKLRKILKIFTEEDSEYCLIMQGLSPAGIITSKDILSQLEESGTLDLDMMASSAMNYPLHTCNHDDTLLTVCNKMGMENIEVMPVMKKNRLVGIITSPVLIEFMSFNG